MQLKLALMILKDLFADRTLQLSCELLSIVRTKPTPPQPYNASIYIDSRGGSRRVAKFLSKSNIFHIKSKVIRMLSCKNFATLLHLPLDNQKIKLSTTQKNK